MVPKLSLLPPKQTPPACSVLGEGAWHWARRVFPAPAGMCWEGGNNSMRTRLGHPVLEAALAPRSSLGLCLTPHQKETKFCN